MKSKKLLALSVLLCLLPILAGAALYGRLPESVPTHFDFNGTPDGWSPRPVAVFGIPAFMAAMQLVLWFALNADPKRKNMSGALLSICLWIVPVLSVVCSVLTLGNALGYQMGISTVIPTLVGVLFILIGNYLPKTKQSYTMGIRLPWTLHSEENWNRTHRLAGFLWVACGAAFVALSLLRLWNSPLFLALLLIMTLVPAAYSYLLYRKGI